MKMIVCVSENFGIGNEGELLFSLPPDMKFFRETTLNKVVVMGRATLDSFPGGKPLKNRVNIVLTRDKDFRREGAIAVTGIDELLGELSKYSDDDVFVIGGAEIYNLLEPFSDEALVTKVKKEMKADKFFFNIDKKDGWKLHTESDEMEYEGIKFTFCRYIKDNSGKE